MIKGGGKIKGSQFERSVCRALSLWLTDEKNPNVLWRSAMSGGRSTLALKSGNQINYAQAGDISSVSSEGHDFISRVYIECKFYKSLGIQNALFLQPSKLLTFWQVAIRDASAHNKIPVLIAKENYFPEIVLTTDKLWDYLVPTELFSNSKDPTIRIGNNSSTNNLLVLKLETLITNYKFSVVKGMSHASSPDQLGSPSN